MTTQTATRPRSPAQPSEQARTGRCLPASAEAIAGQQLATAFLVRGCEQALFDLRCSLGAAGTSGEVRIGLGAIALLEEILAGWREAHAALQARAELGAPPSDSPTADARRRSEPAPS